MGSDGSLMGILDNINKEVAKRAANALGLAIKKYTDKDLKKAVDECHRIACKEFYDSSFHVEFYKRKNEGNMYDMYRNVDTEFEVDITGVNNDGGAAGRIDTRVEIGGLQGRNGIDITTTVFEKGYHGGAISEKKDAAGRGSGGVYRYRTPPTTEEKKRRGAWKYWGSEAASESPTPKQRFEQLMEEFSENNAQAILNEYINEFYYK